MKFRKLTATLLSAAMVASLAMASAFAAPPAPPGDGAPAGDPPAAAGAPDAAPGAPDAAPGAPDAAPGGEMPGGDMPGGPGGGPGGPGGAAEPNPESPSFYEAEGSDLPAIEVGSFGNKYAYPRYVAIQNESNTSVAIDDSTSWHNGAIFSEAGKYDLSGSIKMDTKADGKDTNDFSGLGAAVMAAGKGVTLNVSDANIETTGVAKLALFTDNGAVSIVKNSTLTANGGVIYDGYMSTADQVVMVSPPWVLGLGGNASKPVNARTTNIMGNYSTAAYVDSVFNAAGWGALSTDSGTNMHMVVVNSAVNVTKAAGYGAYTIGETTEDYYGVTEKVTTYANIMTGGKATYTSYTGGQEIGVTQFDENSELEHTFQGMGGTSGIVKNGQGTVVATVKSDKVADGEKVVSKIVSDEFGFMCHANASDGYNVVELLDGTEVESGNAIFLVKKINAIFNVDNAKLTSGNNVLVQIIDNDDDYVGVDPTLTWGHDNMYGHTDGAHMPTFNLKFHEEAGYSNQWIAATSAAGQSGYNTSSNWTVDYNMTNTTATGDLWNSSGYVGSNPATTLNVNLGAGANLTGVISAGAFSHTTKDATVGNGDWTGADALGHVTNIVNSNGVNLVNVTLTGDAAWNVTGDSIVTNLTAKSAAITAGKAVTITVTGTLTLDGEEVTGEKTVGNVTYKVSAPAVDYFAKFEDLDANKWYAKQFAPVQAMLDKGLMVAANTAGTQFAPDATLTNAQVAVILFRNAGSPAVEGEAPANVPSWAADAVKWALAEGVLTADVDVQATATREGAILMLYRAAKAAAPAEDNLAGYADVASVSAGAVDAMKWAVAQEIVQGNNNNELQPSVELSRLVGAMLLGRYFEK